MKFQATPCPLRWSGPRLASPPALPCAAALSSSAPEKVLWASRTPTGVESPENGRDRENFCPGSPPRGGEGSPAVLFLRGTGVQ